MGNDTTRPDTRPIPVADGWVGAEMRVFTLSNSITTDGWMDGPMDGRTDGPMDRRTDKASKNSCILNPVIVALYVGKGRDRKKKTIKGE